MLRRAIQRMAGLYPLLGLLFILLVPAVILHLVLGSAPALVPPSAPSPAPARPSPPVASPIPYSSPTAEESPTPAPGTHVGIQAGHWLTFDVPEELSSLRLAEGATGADWDEVVVNLQVAERVTDILRREGLNVDLLPATVPEGYRADVFVALHADAADNTELSGFKVARAVWSVQPDVDDALVHAIYTDYQAATGLREDVNRVTEDMTEYYAFNWTKYLHSVSPTTPAAIIEMGYMTNDNDRWLLLHQQETVARAIAKSVLDFLGRPSQTGL
jgi:hypothetical protein